MSAVVAFSVWPFLYTPCGARSSHPFPAAHAVALLGLSTKGYASLRVAAQMQDIWYGVGLEDVWWGVRLAGQAAFHANASVTVGCQPNVQDELGGQRVRDE